MMNPVDLSTALRNMVAGGFEILLMVLGVLGFATAVVWFLDWTARRTNREQITRGFAPTPKSNRALEAANRTPVKLVNKRPPN